MPLSQNHTARHFFKQFEMNAGQLEADKIKWRGDISSSLPSSSGRVSASDTTAALKQTLGMHAPVLLSGPKCIVYSSAPMRASSVSLR